MRAKRSKTSVRVLGDEARIKSISARLSEGFHSDTPHLDEGDGHFDFGGHSDLHLDVPHGDEDMQFRDPAIVVSLQTKEAINEWVRLVNQRLIKVERKLSALEQRSSGK
jgi:hypothetical protein